MKKSTSNKAWLFAFIDVAFILVFILMLQNNNGSLYEDRFSNKIVSVEQKTPLPPDYNPKNVTLYIESDDRIYLFESVASGNGTKTEVALDKVGSWLNKILTESPHKSFSVKVAPLAGSSAQAYISVVSLLIHDFNISPITILNSQVPHEP